MSNSNTKPYQFIPGAPRSPRTSPIAEKENDLALVGSAANIPPSTPATRLPLADLIGNIDEAATSTCFAANVSPDDHIHWLSKVSPGNSQSKATPQKHTKKRPRSSSPPSSHSLRPKGFSSGEGALDVSPLEDASAPQIDPAADLWNRYAINTRNTLSAAPAENFARLLDASSPQPGYNHAGSVGGLRRWTSCGVEWPSAGRKRRKPQLSSTRNQIEDVFSDLPDRLTDDGSMSKMSRIGLLVERIQETLTRPSRIEEMDAPSSSSPLPDRIRPLVRVSTSPSSGAATNQESRAQFELPFTKFAQADVNHDQELEGIEAKKPSNLGRDDADKNGLDNIQDVPDLTKPTTLIPRTNSNAVLSTIHPSESWDEFEEVEEISPEDFEIAVSMYDKQMDLNDIDEKDEVRSSSSPKRLKIEAYPGNSSDKEFDDDEIDEASLAAAEVAATQGSGFSGSSNQAKLKRNHTIQRYLVKNVYHGDYTTEQGDKRPQKVVAVEDEKSGMRKSITLRQSWLDTPCAKGSYVHVVGEFSKTGQCLVNDDQNLLIVHPDHLISATAIADSFTCLRRAVLQDRIKATSEASPPLLFGTLLHEIFQAAISGNRWDSESLTDIIHRVIQRHIEDVYAVKLSVPNVFEHLQSKMPELRSWATKFIRDEPQAESLVKDRNDKYVMMSINKLLDIEEHIWSPIYGLKGNIDATVQVTMIDEHEKRTLAVPFEIKTGKNTLNAAHRVQTALYTLLLANRYDISVDYGVLYYLESSDISRVAAVRHELRHMIMQRNELASFVRERLSLPPVLKQPHVCNRCYAKTTCLLYHKLSEEGTSETSGLGRDFENTVAHLTPNDQFFFKKWDELLTHEESEMVKFRRELWTMLSHEREKVGRCFANVILEPNSVVTLQEDSKINRFHYTLIRDSTMVGRSFNDSQISVGEPIIISDENGHYALAKGYVTYLQQQRVTVAVDRQIHRARTKMPGFDEHSSQVFPGMDINAKNSPVTQDGKILSNPQRFRLDKDEFSNGMATVRNNLVQIMAVGTFRAREIRSLVVEQNAPRFKISSTPYAVSGPLSQANINDDQKAAIEKILAAQDYALVLGMPGTGKTTTIAHIIRALVKKGKSVLLTSYTHTAVDNILLKIRDDNIGILRLGATAKIHPQVREFAILAERTPATIEEVEKSYQEPQIVATTCLGINHRIFHERIFDYCIVDEASQITVPVCLGPIRMARVFVLVGDHYQLPPLVQNASAREGGLDVSLFKVLSEKHPSAVVTLNHQYRMNEDIMSLSNTLIYGGRLICGDQAIAQRRLEISSSVMLASVHCGSDPANSHKKQSCKFRLTGSCWINDILGPSSSAVVFLNTDPLQSRSHETVRANQVTNRLEASLAAQLVRSLLSAGIAPVALGVVTLYRSQLALIKSLLRSPEYGINTLQADGVEAHTADRYQGRDKDVILLSCVRSNENGSIGELLKDWRRVNVALTRAKKKMIILGSKQTLASGDVLLGQLIDLCESRGWMYQLPLNADDEEAHIWAASSCTSSKQQPMKNCAIGSQKNASRSRIPAKIGVISGRGIIGPNARAKRPVLVDIVNEVLGDQFLD